MLKELEEKEEAIHNQIVEFAESIREAEEVKAKRVLQTLQSELDKAFAELSDIQLRIRVLNGNQPTALERKLSGLNWVEWEAPDGKTRWVVETNSKIPKDLRDIGIIMD